MAGYTLEQLQQMHGDDGFVIDSAPQQANESLYQSPTPPTSQGGGLTREQVLAMGGVIADEAPIKPVKKPMSKRILGEGIVGNTAQAIPGIIGKRREDFQRAKGQFQSGDITRAEAGLQLVGAGAGAFTDILGKGIGETVKAIGETPMSKGTDTLGERFGRGLKRIGNTPISGGTDTLGERLGRGVSNIIGSQPVQAGVQAIESRPRLKANLQAVGNIASVIPVERALLVGGKALVKNVSPIVKRGTMNASLATQDIARSIDSAYEPIRQAKIANQAKQLDSIIGQVAQGKVGDISTVKKGLSNIDLTGIKTYDGLGTVLDDKIKLLSNKLDEVLPTVKKPVETLVVTEKVGDKVVSHNYVNDALNNLEELYTKTNDPVGLEKVLQLKDDALTNGLSVKEVNDLSRLHSREFSSKAFSKTGEPLTSVNAQSFENTRKGLKTTARNEFGNDVYGLVDDEISQTIKTRDLIKKVAVKANDLNQRIMERGLGQKAGRLAFQIVNAVSGGAVSGFVQSFIPRSGGLKIMNALDLEKRLQKNLRLIDEVINSSLPEKNVIQKMEDILKNTQSSSAFVTNQSTKNIVNTTPTKLIETTVPKKTLGVKGELSE